MPLPPLPWVAFTIEPWVFVVVLGVGREGEVCHLVNTRDGSVSPDTWLGSVLAMTNGMVTEFAGPRELEAEVLRVLAAADAADAPVFAPRGDDRRPVRD